MEDVEREKDEVAGKGKREVARVGCMLIVRGELARPGDKNVCEVGDKRLDWVGHDYSLDRPNLSLRRLCSSSSLAVDVVCRTSLNSFRL